MTRRAAVERDRAELADQRAGLQRDDRAERDGDQAGRQDRDAGDEPALLQELTRPGTAAGTTARPVSSDIATKLPVSRKSATGVKAIAGN